MARSSSGPDGWPDVTLRDSLIRKRKGRLGAVGGTILLDSLHPAAALGRELNTGAAQAILEEAVEG